MAEIRGSYYYGTGRRKTAVARVRLFPGGDGTIIVNGKDSNQYFGNKMFKRKFHGRTARR